MRLLPVRPKTDNQDKIFHSFESGKHLLVTGSAGTGKTYLSMYLGLKELEGGVYRKLVVIRSIVPTRDPGFLPGSLKEKTRVYELPYDSICSDLYDRGDAWEVLKQRGTVEFTTTSFVRGTTFNDSIIVVDEVQNMKWHEIDSIITRVGENCRIIVAGDFKQSDLTRIDEKRGIIDFMRVVKRMPSFDLIEMEVEDVVRSGTVKEFILARDSLGIGD